MPTQADNSPLYNEAGGYLLYRCAPRGLSRGIPPYQPYQDGIFISPVMGLAWYGRPKIPYRARTSGWPRPYPVGCGCGWRKTKYLNGLPAVSWGTGTVSRVHWYGAGTRTQRDRTRISD